MKLCFVVGNITAYGGTERVATEVVTALSNAGHHIIVCSLFGPAKPWFELPKSVTVVSAGLKPAAGSFTRAIAISRYLYNLQRQSDIQGLVLVDSILFAFCVPWVWCSSAKVVCWEHFNLATYHGTRMRGLARFAASRLSSRVVVLTLRDQIAWRQKYFVNKRIQVINNPIPHFKEPLPSAPTSSDVPAVVLAVGRLTAVKGFDLLLRAWHELGETRHGWQLRIIGDGEEEAALKALASKYNVDESVLFPGRISDMSSEYRAASLYVLSSLREGFSMTLLEAQYFGLPSVATDCPTGPREILSHGSGLLVDSEDSAALAKGLKTLMTDKELRREMSGKAIENAKRYSSEKILLEWEALFEDLGLT
jgi:glycosyltransferase involved in cell wall biosynthesis